MEVDYLAASTAILVPLTFLLNENVQNKTEFILIFNNLCPCYSK